MRVLLELIRIILLFAIVGGILGNFIGYAYLEMGINTEKHGWMGFTSVFILLVVLYRNKWQFSGWYVGKGRVKLPKRVSRILIFSSISLLLLPPVLSFIF
ncbi:hypothetical protein [Psychrobacillus lasiicapitis]|uniref:Uncharacterized protein n=1 Tax=Psychrobacillus lasiicapitis TaxID=1636719 RepID=A0A544SRI6_9BACI|nr:hypothetical protein [Psychrobacillus lasiicapitis]TQR07817.1 hypothetical protein FG382_22145 [Psychrobacillus lasiicapitis]GGA48936.1 hypothetical protein GCM10011384_43290 [Psychrobacillus lasiicapitis]